MPSVCSNWNPSCNDGNTWQNYGYQVSGAAEMDGLQLIALDIMQNPDENWITSSQTELILDDLKNEPDPCSRPASVMSYGEDPMSGPAMMDHAFEDYLEKTSHSDDSRSMSPFDDFLNMDSLCHMTVPRGLPPPPYTALVPQPGAPQGQAATPSLPNYDAAVMATAGPRGANASVEHAMRRDPVKLELRSKITARRTKNGLAMPILDTQPPHYEMTDADVDRKERRRASNRKAAKKCRIRKLSEQKDLQTNYKKVLEENEDLRKEISRLRTRNNGLKVELDRHHRHCQLDTGRH